MGYALLCVISGFAGALSTKLLDDKGQLTTLQIKRLEILDGQKNVRAILSAEDDDTVSLRLFSKENRPIVTLAAGSPSVGTQVQPPHGKLSINNGDGRPVVELRTEGNGLGRLVFSSPRITDQVTVGYSQYGDFKDGHQRGAWGIQLAGPDHTEAGLHVFSLDGVLQGTTIPLEAPGLAHQ